MGTSSARGDVAKAAIVEAAERLFAEHGIAGVSLRDISVAAGQRNNSAAQYHFGDRAGLVVAVFEHRMSPVDERRRVLLADLGSAGRLDDLPALVEAVVAPLVEAVAEADGWYGRFLARTRWEPAVWERIGTLPAAESFRDAAVLIIRCVDVPHPIRRSRVDQLVTLVMGTIAGWEGAPERGERRLPVPVLVAELVSTGVALLTAPVTAFEGTPT
ncbi:MAG TPA: TetR family transcriptional regulator [Acidimicrobiales bacterium]